MSAVYVFSSIGRFQSFKDLRKYIDKSYTADGVGIPSDFIQEVGLSEYEPACIEAVVSETGIIPLEELLADVSYADQWKINFPLGRKADAAICVYPPNELQNPQNCTLDFIGLFHYDE